MVQRRWKEDGVATFSHPSSGAAAGGVFVRHFSTGELPVQDQFGAWRSMLSDTIDLLPTSESSGPFEADFSSWTFGDIVLTRTFYTNAPERHWLHRPKSFLDHWCVVLAHERGRGSAYPDLRSPAHLSFRSLAMPFEGKARDTEVLTLFLPRDFCRDEREDFERAHGLEINPELGAILAGHMESLAQHLPHISAEHAQGLAVATRSLVAACITSSRPHGDAERMSLSDLLIGRIRIAVRQNMASPEFNPDQLARLMAMSRSKLYRLFEQTGGVAHFINRERLQEAHRRLAAPRDALPIHIIGNEVGFTDHSTFSRAFRREFGYSPSEVRERSIARHSAAPFDVLAGDKAADDDTSSPAGVRTGDQHSPSSIGRMPRWES